MLIATLLALAMLGDLLRDSLHSGSAGVQVAVGWGTYALAIAGLLFIGVPAVQARLRAWIDRAPARAFALVVPPVLLFVLCGAALGHATMADNVLFAIWLSAIVLVGLLARRRIQNDGRRGMTGFDLLVLVAFWAGGKAMADSAHAWSIPPLPSLPHEAPVGPGSGSLLLAMALALAVFTVLRPIEDLGFSWGMSGADMTMGVACYSAFTLLALPVALWSGFAHPHPAPAWDGLDVMARLGVVFLYAATLEEFFFRGVFLNLIGRAIGGPNARWWGYLIASVMFGALHFFQRKNGGPMYALLATLAGLFYGYGYLRTGRLSVAILAHALVDFTWVMAFNS
ncbi:MAG: CPBP family glutamic-type intramembrane protease [Candidatus Xenobia bacterium]